MNKANYQEGPSGLFLIAFCASENLVSCISVEVSSTDFLVFPTFRRSVFYGLLQKLVKSTRNSGILSIFLDNLRVYATIYTKGNQKEVLE